MFQFFVEKAAVQPTAVCIIDANLNHMKNVLRMKVGEQFYVSVKDDSCKYLCELEGYEEDMARCHIIEAVEDTTELPCEITLYQGLPKSDKMELIIQKAVELGVSHIVPVGMERSVVKLDDKKAKSKIDRWNAIAESAAKQSKRDVIPTIGAVLSYKQALGACKEQDVIILPFEHAEGMNQTRKVLEGIEKGQSIAIFVGPEGGFSDKEIELALAQDIHVITLGKRILRTETASLAILSMLGYLLED
ncbi:MAG: RsmE family RNA methyltransferase [Lachnospiraceae bacterium]